MHVNPPTFQQKRGEPQSITVLIHYLISMNITILTSGTRASLLFGLGQRARVWEEDELQEQELAGGGLESVARQRSEPG